MLLLNHN